MSICMTVMLRESVPNRNETEEHGKEHEAEGSLTKRSAVETEQKRFARSQYARNRNKRDQMESV